ncbi:MAG: hypothetical protein KBT87_08230 [Gammaproteobacteria bacterium]|nr:hypothetical protein [Gammaproteobacteria bacterium]MBQ0774642.1 hypothetical protein [Gammaproteobacteria bacterium]
MNREAWENGIGRFMLAAGVVELRMIQLMWNIAIPHSHEDVWIKLDFGRKIQKVKELVKASNIPSPLDVRLRLILGEAKQVMQLRNIVAHSPLSACIAFSEQGMDSELRLRVLRNTEKTFSFDDLNDAIRRVETLDEDLLSVVCDDNLWNWSPNNKEE